MIRIVCALGIVRVSSRRLASALLQLPNRAGRGAVARNRDFPLRACTESTQQVILQLIRALRMPGKLPRITQRQLGQSLFVLGASA